jgi:surface antigen
VSRLARLGLGLALLSGLAGCGNTAQQSAGPVGGAAVSLGVAGITANPLIAYAAGVGAEAGIEALENDLARVQHNGEQNNIAAKVARLRTGQSASWQISYRVPFLLHEHGDVTVLQVLRTPLVTCKRVAFTVITGNKPDSGRGIYITTACARSDGVWKWAEAEPATERWGFLQ